MKRGKKAYERRSSKQYLHHYHLNKHTNVKKKSYNTAAQYTQKMTSMAGLCLQSNTSVEVQPIRSK